MNNNDLAIVRKFIYNDETSKIIHKINSNFLSFNILDITGMGTQEIKHSNVLAWILDNKEHNLKYEILTEFLKKLYEYNYEDFVEFELQNYIYLQEKKDINVFREFNDIDLLIEDSLNKVIFVIENKIKASERIDGDDGGQLNKYEDYISKTYDSTFKKYYIFLTPDLKNASKENWLSASYQMITDSILEIIENRDLSANTLLVLESYVDLLKRGNIVSDKELENLCKKIWNNQEYKKALEIIYNNRPNKSDFIINFLDKYMNNHGTYELKESSGNYNYFIKFNNHKLILRLAYSINKRKIVCSINSSEEDKDSDVVKSFKSLKFEEMIFKPRSSQQLGFNKISNDVEWVIEEEEITENKLETFLNSYKSALENM